MRLDEARQIVRQGISGTTDPGGIFRRSALGEEPPDAGDGFPPALDPPMPGTGRPTTSGTGTIQPPDWQRDEAGIWYDANTGISAPEWMQERLDTQGPGDPLAGTIPLTTDPNYYVSSPSVTPNATRFVDQYGNILNPQGRNVTESERDRLVGLFGGDDGGGGSGVSWANLAQRQREFQEELRNNAFARQMEYISALAEEEANADARQQTFIETLMAAAPNAPAGDFYGGYGPHGGATLLELMQGGLGAPRNVRVQPVDVQKPRPANTGIIESALGAYL